MINIHSIGEFLLYAALVASVFSGLASLVGYSRRDGRLLMAGERAGYVVTGIIVTASLLLMHAFLTHDYVNKYVERYSDNNMPWYYLIASFWGGQAGSLMFWVLVLSICISLVIWQNREKNRDILPTVIATLMVINIFFLAVMVLEANPFAQFQINEPPVNGKGLEPLLQNPAMTFHPPSILSGYVWFSVPFAFAVAAMIHKRLDDTWIRTTRRYAVVSWGFLSVGNLFGGMWAYQELGWGGFWGWDPVENASFMPWLTATAYLHSVMIQERRGMLRIWNISLVFLTYFLTVFGTALTRSGLIDSVHTFAQSDIGNYFIVALIVLAVFCVGLTVWRVVDGSLASTTTLEGLFSREGVFLLNNWLLIGAMCVVMLGTIGEKLSAYFWQETKYTATWFNTWMVPIGIALLLLMSIGPLISWRKATLRNFRNNFAIPIVVVGSATALFVFSNAFHILERLEATSLPIGSVPLARLLADAELTGVYSTVAFFGVLFAVYTLCVEFVRGTIVRSRSTNEKPWTALWRLVSKNRRRYGGYLTHIGFAFLFLGFIGVGLKTEVDLQFAGQGSTKVVEDRHLTFEGMEKNENREFEQWDAIFTVRTVSEDGGAGELVAELRPARRFYHGHNVKMSKTTTEKDETHELKANLYLTLISFRPGLDTVEVTAHYNPMIIWMWIGGAFLLLGVFFAIWPEAERYPVFAAALKAKKKRAAPTVGPVGSDPVALARRAAD